MIVDNEPREFRDLHLRPEAHQVALPFTTDSTDESLSHVAQGRAFDSTAQAADGPALSSYMHPVLASHMHSVAHSAAYSTALDPAEVPGALTVPCHATAAPDIGQFQQAVRAQELVENVDATSALMWQSGTGPGPSIHQHNGQRPDNSLSMDNPWCSTAAGPSHVTPFSANQVSSSQPTVHDRYGTGLPPLAPHRQSKTMFPYKQGQQGGAPVSGTRRHSQETFAAAPTLAALRRENKVKTSKYFSQKRKKDSQKNWTHNGRKQHQSRSSGQPRRGANRDTASFLRSVPRAPDNPNSYLMKGPGISPNSTTNLLISPANGIRQFHTNTPNPFQPGGTFKNSFGQLMALGNELTELSGSGGINLFGTNEGLITRVSHNDGNESSDFSEHESDLEDGFELHAEDLSTSHEPVPAHARARLQEQAACIADLQEQNMSLKEKISLLEQEVTELKCQLRLSGQVAPSQAEGGMQQMDAQEQNVQVISSGSNP